MRDHLGISLILLVVATVLVSSIIIFKNQKTVHATYNSGKIAAADIGKLINN